MAAKLLADLGLRLSGIAFLWAQLRLYLQALQHGLALSMCLLLII
jgi:hypothetical protein